MKINFNGTLKQSLRVSEESLPLDVLGCDNAVVGVDGEVGRVEDPFVADVAVQLFVVLIQGSRI